MIPRGWVVAVRRKTTLVIPGQEMLSSSWRPAFEGAAFASKRVALEMAEKYRAHNPELTVRVLREGIVR